MTEERHLPPGDARRAEVAPPIEHRAPEKLLPINGGMNNNTPHFQFTSF